MLEINLTQELSIYIQPELFFDDIQRQNRFNVAR